MLVLLKKRASAARSFAIRLTCAGPCGRRNHKRSSAAAGKGDRSLGGKWLELLSEIAPGLKRAAIMFNPDTSPASAYMPSVETAAPSLKVAPVSASVHSDVSDVEIETARC
jgi:hypothetical protein